MAVYCDPRHPLALAGKAAWNCARGNGLSRGAKPSGSTVAAPDTNAPTIRTNAAMQPAVAAGCGDPHRGLAELKTVTSPMASDEVMMCRKKHSASPPPVFDDSSQFRGAAACRWTESTTSFRLENACFAHSTSSLAVPQRMTLTRGASLSGGLVAVPDMAVAAAATLTRQLCRWSYDPFLTPAFGSRLNCAKANTTVV
eukprot:scaffold91799_cov63-Phaeocystis_antarctica.AAC.3